MPSIKYEEVYSRFYTKVEAYDLFEDNVTDETRDEFLCNWLHSAVFYPYVRRLFSSIDLVDKDHSPIEDDPDTKDVDETKDNSHTIIYQMKYAIDDATDKEFVLEVLATGMVLSWVRPKVNSIINTAQVFSNSDAKFYSQSNHLSELENLRYDTQAELRNMIRDRGYANNTYLDGTGTT